MLLEQLGDVIHVHSHYKRRLMKIIKDQGKMLTHSIVKVEKLKVVSVEYIEN
jgi:hypothetical protein